MHVIHDLRIVLLVLAQCLDSLRKHPDPETLNREVDTLALLVNAGLAMANELLTDSRQPVEPIDVNDVIARAADVIQAIVGPAVRVEASLAPRDSRVYARQVDLHRILLNIVCNAAAAMPSGGVLSIETKHLPPRAEDGKRFPDMPFGLLRLTVGDTGPGVPSREVLRVRDSAQQPRPDGSGIGLSSVALVLLRLGGQLEIVGREDIGTVVEITLPLAPPALQRIH
jgi:two-component system, cell cycle sensor histidine kinase and response regulator CckA